MPETFFSQPVQTSRHPREADFRDFTGARQGEAPFDPGVPVQDAAIADCHVFGTAGEFPRHADHPQEFEHIGFAEQHGFGRLRPAQIAVVVQFDGFEQNPLSRLGELDRM